MSTDGIPLNDKKVYVKFFCSWSRWTWYAFEGSEMENGYYEFFGMVDSQCKEMGGFLLSELEGIRGPGGLRIERDMHFSITNYSEVA